MRGAHNIEAVEFEGRLVLAGQRRQALLVLNETARIVWETMRAGVGAEEMAALLAQGYGVPLARATADVEAVLDQWRAHGLLEEPDRTPDREDDGVNTRRGRTPARPEFRVQGVYDLCGTAFRLRVEQADIASWMHLLLAHAETPGADAEHVLDLVRDGADHVVVHNGRERQRDASLELAAGSVVRAICDVSYPDADWSLFMHAAAVARGDHAVVLPGTNGSGKSTLTAALVRSGLDYLSDDVVPLDGRTARVMPVPFAISVKEGSWRVLAGLYPALRTLPVHGFGGGRRQRYLPPPPRVGQGPRRGGAAVKALVFPRFQPQERLAALTPLSPLQALVKLADARCLMSLERERLGPTLEWLRAVPAYELIHSNLDEATAIVLWLLKT